MKITSVIASGIALFSTVGGVASATMPSTGATLTFETATTVTGGAFSGLPSTLVFDTGATQSGATHMLIGPMSASPTGANAYAGSYRMVNASTGADVSSGIVQFSLPYNATYVGNRQVVGVIPLSGGLANSSLTLSTPSALLDGITASVSYDSEMSAMQVTIDSDVSNIPYVAVDESTLVFESPFWIRKNATDYKFNGGYVRKQDDGSYQGIVTTAGGTNYAVTLKDPNDSDSDHVSGLTDADNYWYSGSIYYKGAVYSSWLGWFNFFYPPANTGAWGDYSISSHAYIWHYDHGLLYTYTVKNSEAVWLYIYDMQLGWLATNENLYPYFYAFDVAVNNKDYGETWLYYKSGGSGSNRLFFACTGGMNRASNMGPVDQGFQGWWSIPGANAIK